MIEPLVIALLISLIILGLIIASVIERGEEEVEEERRSISKSNMAVIGNKIYEVDKSIFVTQLDDRYNLHKTQKGNYFIVRNQHWELDYYFIPNLRWFFDVVDDITPISKDETIKILDRLEMYDLIKNEFGDRVSKA